MGFGILLFGYMTMLGFFPDLFIYINRFAIFIAIGGSLLIFAAFFKLGGYNIYFKIMKYIAVLYTLILIGFTPFLWLVEPSDEAMLEFLYISRIIRILFLFMFHYIMLSGICALAKDVDNQKVYRGARFNIYFTYVYFGFTILGVFELGAYYIIIALLMSLIYYVRVLACIYKCFVWITYEGHDEERERKQEEKEQAKKNKK